MPDAAPARGLRTIASAVWHLIPGPLRRLLASQGGRRLIRFAPAAVLALAATQLTYFVCQLLNVTAGKAGAAGWFAGALVSYLVSRWAWERKGRPNVLKETLPFVCVSVCVGIVLTGASKLGGHEARALELHGAEKVVFAQALYLAANCVTFIVRFLIFHYVLFADRGSAAGASRAARTGPLAAAGPEDAGEPEAAVTGAPLAGSRPAADAGPAAPLSRDRRLRSRTQVRRTTPMKRSA